MSFCTHTRRKRTKASRRGADGLVPGSSKCGGTLWSKEEREMLLGALREYGIMDMERLQEAAPNKSEEQIKSLIVSVWRDSRRAVVLNKRLTDNLANKKPDGDHNHLGPVDKWLEIINNHFKGFEEYKRLPLARAILMIAKYEQHPDPTECGGIDFKAMYEFLYCILCGFPTKDLNQPSAAHVLETLSNFASMLKNRDITEELKFLESVVQIKCPEIKRAKDEVIEDALQYTLRDCYSEFLDIPGCNPLGVPLEMLLKRGGNTL